MKRSVRFREVSRTKAGVRRVEKDTYVINIKEEGIVDIGRRL